MGKFQKDSQRLHPMSHRLPTFKNYQFHSQPLPLLSISLPTFKNYQFHSQPLKTINFTPNLFLLYQFYSQSFQVFLPHLNCKEIFYDVLKVLCFVILLYLIFFSNQKMEHKSFLITYLKSFLIFSSTELSPNIVNLFFLISNFHLYKAQNA